MLFIERDMLLTEEKCVFIFKKWVPQTRKPRWQIRLDGELWQRSENLIFFKTFVLCGNSWHAAGKYLTVSSVNSLPRRINCPNNIRQCKPTSHCTDDSRHDHPNAKDSCTVPQKRVGFMSRWLSLDDYTEGGWLVVLCEDLGESHELQ